MSVLGHEIVASESGSGERCLFVLHGVFGAGRNWRSFARQYVEAHPEWRAVLVDLRGHGDSRGLPGPHTLAACADDLRSLSQRVGAPEVVWGHSFGGKVALAFLAAAGAEGPRAVWSFDSPPGSGPAGGGDPLSSEVGRLMSAVDEIPMPMDRRSALGPQLRELGFSSSVASWMGTNLERRDDGFHWSFDPPVLRELLADYWAQDLWPVAINPPGTTEVHLVRAQRSDRWTADDCQRLEDAVGPRTHVHVLADAGHWLQVDAPVALMGLLDGAGEGEQLDA